MDWRNCMSESAKKMSNILINKVFTIPYIDKMINDSENKDIFFDCVRKYTEGRAAFTYGDAIGQLYRHMDSSYRNEYFYKNAILNQLLIEKHDIWDSAALTELPIGDSKADFVIINGRGTVYEIKTDLDNFSRLEHQIADYYKAFKYVNVVVGYKQYEKVKAMLEGSGVGIFVMERNGKLRCRKAAKCKDKYLCHETIFRILRKNEFESILYKHFGKLPEVNSFLYYRECRKWLSDINVKTFQKDMLEYLKKRIAITDEKTFEEKIPYELRFYAYFTKQKKNQYQIINEFWNNKMEG